MLSVSDKKGEVVGDLSSGDYEDMLAAFARNGATAEQRERGAAVVRKYQQLGRWFRCDCLGLVDRAPILVPVKEAFVRREAQYPDHADACPFEMEVADRERQIASLRQRVPADGFLLARAIVRAEAAPVRDEEARESEKDASETWQLQGLERVAKRVHYRTGLSQLLFKVLHDARVHRVGAKRRMGDEQRDDVHRAARGIPLGTGLQLAEVLGTDPGQLAELVGRIEARRQWPKGRRPHGVLIFVADRLDDDDIVAVSDARITVMGSISVFGPGKGNQRSGPFVAVVLITSPDGRAPLVPLDAYVHPCWSVADMLPMDSTHERRCLDILIRFQGWMATKGYAVGITKPFYDRSKNYLGREEADFVVKPDFEGTIHAGNGTFVRSFVVEVMGYNHSEYVAKKRRLKTIATDKRSHFIEHLAHDESNTAKHDRDLILTLADFGERATKWFEKQLAQQLLAASVQPPLLVELGSALPRPEVVPLAVPLVMAPDPPRTSVVVRTPQPAPLPAQRVWERVVEEEPAPTPGFFRRLLSWVRRR